MTSLADTFTEIVDSLPDDWTDLEFDLRIFDERRYVDAAGHGRVEIPDRAVAFTVKLPEGLVGRVRAYAAEHRLAISAVVAAALVEFLARDRGGRPER